MHNEIYLQGQVEKGHSSWSTLRQCKEDDSAHLPDPFILPTNFRPDIEVCLKSGKMTRLARAIFLSTVAGAMFQYKIPKSG